MIMGKSILFLVRIVCPPPKKKKIIMQPIAKKNKNKKSRNLFKFLLVLLSASVERVGFSRRRDFWKQKSGLAGTGGSGDSIRGSHDDVHYEWVSRYNMYRKEISNVITVAGDGSRESASVRSSRHPEDHLCPLDAAVILQVIVRELGSFP